MGPQPHLVHGPPTCTPWDEYGCFHWVLASTRRPVTVDGHSNQLFIPAAAGAHETAAVHTDDALAQQQAAIELAERDADHGYDQTYHASKLALGFLTALGLICTTGAPFIVNSTRAPHTWGWIFGAVFVVLSAATLISGILTFRSSMPPRHKITEEHTGWVATLAVPPEQLAQHYLDRARRRLASSGAEAQRLASIAHGKHRGNYRTGSLLIGAVLAGLALILALRLGW